MAYFVKKYYCISELNWRLSIILNYEIYVYSIINGACLTVRYYKNEEFSLKTLIFRQKF